MSVALALPVQLPVGLSCEFMPPRKKPQRMNREPASVPPADELTPTGAAALTTGAAIREAHLVECKPAVRHLGELRISDSVLDRVSLADTVIAAARWTDIHFLHCDFSNAVFHALEARRVEFTDCRLTGVKAVRCKFQDVLFAHCDLRYTDLSDGVVETCEFVSSHLGEAVLGGTRFTASTFQDSHLDRADLGRSVWRETDLRGTSIAGISIQDADLRTCIITPAQAMELAVLMGLVIG